MLETFFRRFCDIQNLTIGHIMPQKIGSTNFLVICLKHVAGKLNIISYVFTSLFILFKWYMFFNVFDLFALSFALFYWIWKPISFGVLSVKLTKLLSRNKKIVAWHFFVYPLTEAFRKVVQHRKILLSTEAVSRQINFAVLLQAQLLVMQHSDIPVQLL